MNVVKNGSLTKRRTELCSSNKASKIIKDFHKIYDRHRGARRI